MSRELNAEVVAALWSLVDGLGATIPAIEAQPAIMALESVVAQADGAGGAPASSEVIACVVAEFLEDAADSLEEKPEAQTVPNRAKAARAALNLKAGLQNKPLKAVRGRPGREERIAKWLGYEPPSLKKLRQDGTSPFGALIEDMAEQLVRREVDYLVNARRVAQRARRPPLESAMRVEWLSRFERYYKMWTPIFGIRHGLELALESNRRGEPDAADVYVRMSLYNHAFFLTQLDDFILQHGGLWILPDTRTEDAIADSTWFLRDPMPLSKIDESMLRLKFAANPELVLFTHASYVDGDLQPILEKWREWVLSCRCKRPKRPRAGCKVHATILWAAFYMDTLDAQWDFLADWHDLPRAGSRVDSLRSSRTSAPVLPPNMPIDNQVEAGAESQA